MSKKLSLAACLLSASAASVPMAACSSDNSTTSGGDGGPGGGSSSGGSSGSSGGGSSGGIHDSGVLDAADAGRLGLLVDNMTATKGTAISLHVPAGQTAGSYYAYSDYPVSNAHSMSSLVIGTAQLVDAPIAPPITNADGSQIVGELCFGGTVVGYAGLGMSLAYGNPPDATPESGLSSPVPFDASHYSGVSFYIFVDPSDGPMPSLHFGVPDSQTADPAALPTSTCATTDGGICDDDFGADVPTVAPGTWTKVSFTWADLTQQNFGFPPFSAIKTGQLIGMKWQANGSGFDATSESFNFCISDIYFTP